MSRLLEEFFREQEEDRWGEENEEENERNHEEDQRDNDSRESEIKEDLDDNEDIIKLDELATGTRIDFDGDKLEDDNWIAWRWHFTQFLKSQNLLGAIESEIKTIEDTQALTYIGNALSKKVKNLVVGCENARDAWLRLGTIYENKTTLESLK